MGSSGFKFDESAWERMIEEEIKPKLQAQADEALQGAVREVLAEHKGDSEEVVRAALLAKMQALGFEPSEPGFTETVSAISDGTMEA